MKNEANEKTRKARAKRVFSISAVPPNKLGVADFFAQRVGGKAQTRQAVAPPCPLSPCGAIGGPGFATPPAARFAEKLHAHAAHAAHPAHIPTTHAAAS